MKSCLIRGSPVQAVALDTPRHVKTMNTATSREHHPGQITNTVKISGAGG